MSGIFNQGSTVSGTSWFGTALSSTFWGPRPQGLPTFARRRRVLSRGVCAAALMTAIAVLLVSTIKADTEEMVQLERLSLQIARAQTLAPESREAIDRLIERQRLLAGSGDPQKEVRRRTAIDRVTSAINAKDDGTTGRTIDRRLPN